MPECRRLPNGSCDCPMPALPPLHHDFLRKVNPGLLEATRHRYTEAPYAQFRTAFDALGPAERERQLVDVTVDTIFAELGTVHGRGISALASFERTGQNVYVVGPMVADALRNTSLKGIEAASVAVPATNQLVPQTFYVALADSPWRMWGGQRTTWHRVSGFYVQEISADDVRVFSFYVWGAPNERSRSSVDDIVYSFALRLAHGQDMEDAYGACDPRLHESLSRQAHQKFIYDDKCLGSEDPSVHSEHVQSMKNVAYCAINLMLYLQSVAPSVVLIDNADGVRRTILERRLATQTRRSKRQKTQAELASLSKCVVYHVGQEWEQGEAKSTITGSRNSPRLHFVRPHWRTYWVGPKDVPHKALRWIHSFTRGGLASQ